MVFTKRLREGIRRGRIRCSVRVWTRPHVKVGNRYQMDDGNIIVDSIDEIRLADITYDLARESGFESVDDLLRIARHGRGENIYLIRFHYLPPGGWDTPERQQRNVRSEGFDTIAGGSSQRPNCTLTLPLAPLKPSVDVAR